MLKVSSLITVVLGERKKKDERKYGTKYRQLIPDRRQRWGGCKRDLEENHQVRRVSSRELYAPPNSKRKGMHWREEMLGSCTHMCNNIGRL